VRAVASCPVPIVTAVGHEQDTPLCDLAADARASTPTAAGRLVVPDLNELLERLGRSRSSLQRSVRRSLERERQRLVHARTRLDRAPALALERKRASLEHAHGRLRTLSPRSTLARGYAIVRGSDGIVTSPPASGVHVDVEIADGAFGATVD
jgi:exodeoxyribonuclease VII large subunit